METETFSNLQPYVAKQNGIPFMQNEKPISDLVKDLSNRMNIKEHLYGGKTYSEYCRARKQILKAQLEKMMPREERSGF
jgi:hypothetical protein